MYHLRASTVAYCRRHKLLETSTFFNSLFGVLIDISLFSVYMSEVSKSHIYFLKPTSGDKRRDKLSGLNKINPERDHTYINYKNCSDISKNRHLSISAKHFKHERRRSSFDDDVYKIIFSDISEKLPWYYLSCLKLTILNIRVSKFELLWTSLRLLLKYTCTFNKWSIKIQSRNIKNAPKIFTLNFNVSLHGINSAEKFHDVRKKSIPSDNNILYTDTCRYVKIRILVEIRKGLNSISMSYIFF